MVAETDLVLSATEVAVTVTELFVADGSAEGAVYVVEVPGPLVVNEPHAPLLAPQVTDNFTPALAESLVRVTASDAEAFTWRDAGTAEVNATEIGSTGVVFGLDDPPQAASAALVPAAVNSKNHWRKDIAASVSFIRGCYELRPQ